MASAEKHRPAASFSDWIQFPHHARQSTVSLVITHMIGVRIAGEIQQPASTVRTEIVMPFGADGQESALKPETVAVLGSITGYNKFVHKAEDNRVVSQPFEGASNR